MDAVVLISIFFILVVVGVSAWIVLGGSDDKPSPSADEFVGSGDPVDSGGAPESSTDNDDSDGNNDNNDSSSAHDNDGSSAHDNDGSSAHDNNGSSGYDEGSFAADNGFSADNTIQLGF